MVADQMIPTVCGVLLLLWSQDPDLSEDYRLLQDRLYSPSTDPEERVRMLHDFIERHGAAAKDRRLLAARIQLAGMLLERLESTAALIEFRKAAKVSEDHFPDLHGRVLYGVAQALELEGDPEGARSNLRRIIVEHEGTRYARYARVALARLLSNRDLGPGAPLPELRLGEDLQGRSLRTVDLRGAPVLLVFFDPEHDASRSRLEALYRVWERAGQRDERLIAYAVGADDASLRRWVDRAGWTFSVLRTEEGFLHHDLLALGVTGVPSSFLIGSEGRLLARDLPPDRLATLLARARGRR